MTFGNSLRVLAMAGWLLNAMTFIAAWAQQAPINGFMTAAAVAAMIGAAMWTAEDIWPSLKRNAR